MHSRIINKVQAVAILMLSLSLMSWSIIANAKVIDRIVAVVNGDIITQSDVESYENMTTDAGLDPSMVMTNEGRRGKTLDNMINDTLLNQAVEKSSIEVTDEEVSRAIQNILAQNRMTLDQLKSELLRKGVTYEEYTHQIKLRIKKVKFVNQIISPEVKITERDLRDYFQRNRTSIHGGTEVHLAEIVLSTAGIASQEEALALRDRAYSIVKQSRGNNRAFAKLAKQYSAGPNADKGGDLGIIKIGDLPQRVANTVKNMPEGAVSDPIPTEKGIVIAKVVDWPEISDGDFDAVRDNIYNRLYQVRLMDAVDSYVMRLRQRSYIEIR